MARQPQGKQPTKREREHAPALKQLIAQYRKSGADDLAGWYEALLADTPEARTVREWLKRHARPNLGGLRRMSGRQNCEDWEAELWGLVSVIFVLTKPVSARERAGSSARNRNTKAAANKARALAKYLANPAGPPVPSVLALFDPDRAVDIIRALPPERAQSLLRLTGYSANPGDGYQRTANPVYSEDGRRSAWQDPAANLAHHFGGAWGSAEAAQLFPALLLGLAEYIEATADLERPRLPRPNATNRDAIALARELAYHFQTNHDARPHAVIAALVVIRYPDTDPPPDGNTIEGWVNNKPDQ